MHDVWSTPTYIFWNRIYMNNATNQAYSTQGNSNVDFLSNQTHIFSSEYTQMKNTQITVSTSMNNAPNQAKQHGTQVYRNVLISHGKYQLIKASWESAQYFYMGPNF